MVFQSDKLKFANARNRGRVVYSRRQKMKDFLSTRNNGKLLVGMIIVTVLDVIATVNVLTASNNDVKPVET